MNRLFIAAVFSALCVGCTSPTPTESKDQPRRSAWVGAWTAKEDGSVKEVLLTSDDPDFGTRKLIWMKVGKKVVLPGYMTTGANQGKTPMGVGETKQAWERREPGVFKIDYKPVINEIFAGYKVEIAD